MRSWSLWRSSPDEENDHLPRVGDTVRLQAAGEGQIGVHTARVRAIGLRRLFLDSADASALARLPLVLTFVRGDALYRFETRAVGPARANALAIARPRKVTRLQRRQFYRLSLESPTTFRVLASGSASDPVAARMVNLSGGGALLAASKPVPSGLEVSVRVPSGKDGSALPVEGCVLDCRVATQGASRIFLIRVQFADAPQFPDADRDEIIAYIFEQQRFLLRTRKLLRA